MSAGFRVPREEMLRLKGELDDIEHRRILSTELKQARADFTAALAGADQAPAGAS